MSILGEDEMLWFFDLVLDALLHVGCTVPCLENRQLLLAVYKCREALLENQGIDFWSDDMA